MYGMRTDLIGFQHRSGRGFVGATRFGARGCQIGSDFWPNLATLRAAAACRRLRYLLRRRGEDGEQEDGEFLTTTNKIDDNQVCFTHENWLQSQNTTPY